MTDLETGTRVTCTRNNLGVFDLKCWNATDGRLTSRVYFAADVTINAGMSGTIQGRDHSTEPGWYVVAFGDYVAPMHESMFAIDRRETQ